jgi:hypothetical protein
MRHVLVKLVDDRDDFNDGWKLSGLTKISDAVETLCGTLMLTEAEYL